MAIFLFLLFHLSHPLLCLNLLDNLFLRYFQHYLQCLKNVDLIIKKKKGDCKHSGCIGGGDCETFEGR